MNCFDPLSPRLAQLHAFERPRYFHGQLLDVRHFDSEQEYFRGKLWLINRLVHGYGVVSGLDVQVATGVVPSVSVTPGLALDAWGREIVVDCDSKPIEIAPREATGEVKSEYGPSGEGQDCEDDDWVHLVICYRECATNPEPALGVSCNDGPRCTHGSTRESYTIPAPRPGKAPRRSWTTRLRDPSRVRPFDYCELAEWVTRGSNPCLSEGEDTCLVLANIRRPEPGESITEIDICVRPIVYGLDLLFEMWLAANSQGQNRRGAKT